MHTCRTYFNSGIFFRVDPSREIASRAWHRRPGQRLVRVSPIPELTPVSSVNYSSLSDSTSNSDLVEMADDIVDETEFSPAQIRTITQIIVATLAQDRAQNQTPPASSNQPVVEEREIPEPTSDNQASIGNTVPVENDVIKQLAELKDKVEKMSVTKEKDPITNFHNRKKEKYEIQSPVREPGLNQLFFVPEASGEFQSKGKTYPGLEIFITDFDEQLIKSPEPSFEQFVEGTQFMVGMVQTDSGTEWS
ncbi:hypothetical protein JCGZ_26459 [Jatropha curcas]|uniref:Uncharacterized protein n=1 Tax=Jatropha curcas TaxID=180498 RepID=A0A067JL25_JATCU|nr:hypothetical protein JCGZ_26459 [Jatropha curcas]